MLRHRKTASTSISAAEALAHAVLDVLSMMMYIEERERGRDHINSSFYVHRWSRFTHATIGATCR